MLAWRHNEIPSSFEEASSSLCSTFNPAAMDVHLHAMDFAPPLEPLSLLVCHLLEYQSTGSGVPIYIGDWAIPVLLFDTCSLPRFACDLRSLADKVKYRGSIQLDYGFCKFMLL